MILTADEEMNNIVVVFLFVVVMKNTSKKSPCGNSLTVFGLSKDLTRMKTVTEDYQASPSRSLPGQQGSSD